MSQSHTSPHAIQASEYNFILNPPATYLPPKDHDLRETFIKEEELLVFPYEEHMKIRARMIKESAREEISRGTWEISRRQLMQPSDFTAGLSSGAITFFISTLYHGSFVAGRDLKRAFMVGLGFFSASMLIHLIQTPYIEKDMAEKARLRESISTPAAGQRDLMDIADRWVWNEDDEEEQGASPSPQSSQLPTNDAPARKNDIL